MIRVRKAVRDVRRGAEFGLWIVLGDPFRSSGRIWKAVVQCKCGEISVAECRSLSNGQSTGCGCERPITIHRRLHNIWKSIRQRCSNPKLECFPNYGGRGIAVCAEWCGSYEAFRQWAIDNGYSDDKQIDRIDNDGNYEPSNCRWVTREVQDRNKRTNRMLTIDGETKCIADWLDQYGITRTAFSNRLYILGWPLKKCLTEPVRAKKASRKERECETKNERGVRR